MARMYKYFLRWTFPYLFGKMWVIEIFQVRGSFFPKLVFSLERQSDEVVRSIGYSYGSKDWAIIEKYI